MKRRNLRDLGGLPTRNPGIVVRSGRFYRSSTPARFDVEEHSALVTLQLRSVVDLRMSRELASTVPLPATSRARTLHCPLFETASPNWIAPPDQSPPATARRYFEMLQQGVRPLAAIILKVTEPDATPFIVSCSAGRDRTGIVVACILDLLDVTDEAIANDYALSDGFEQDSGRAHAATIHELLALVRDRYGSTQRMLAFHGVTSHVIEVLRRELVIDSPG